MNCALVPHHHFCSHQLYSICTVAGHLLSKPQTDTTITLLSVPASQNIPVPCSSSPSSCWWPRPPPPTSQSQDRASSKSSMASAVSIDKQMISEWWMMCRWGVWNYWCFCYMGGRHEKTRRHWLQQILKELWQFWNFFRNFGNFSYMSEILYQFWIFLAIFGTFVPFL